MSAKDILNQIINQFEIEKFNNFFRAKNDKLRFPNESIYFNDAENNFTDGKKLAEGELDDGKLIVCSIFVNKELSERTGKKAQYILGKKILREEQADAGIFIFHDKKSNFRFSLIYTNYSGKSRDWSSFKRFTYYVKTNNKGTRQTNKTFLIQVGEGDFSTIENIKKSFSVEPVTKQFYHEIANWYFWAIKNVSFPEDVEKTPNGRNIAIIRFITRIVFVWFMKVRDLIPDDLFEEKTLSNILKDFSLTSDDYYKAILQNLFFATLNTKKEERRFRNSQKGYKGFNTDFGNHNVYRYESLFKHSEKTIEKYFMPIPFLNGGLFECLDYKSKDKDERKYIDGFTDLKKYQPSVPNFLLFAEEKTVDLSEDYNDSKYKNAKVKGLIKILSQYNFTIDENEPNDVEVALDPELLGEIFENLLASYNPEIVTTARKATGSYYTPREIVDYMVDESLKEYFKSNLPTLDEEKINKLFSIEDSVNPFDENTTEKLIILIDSLRIVDPAVGSGAFPMRVLIRLVSLLHKLDPENLHWKKIQIEGVKKSVKDPILQKELICQLEKRFNEKNPDYGRKLYLIEKCIYGVDIQQIAVEIAKLRFFISLLVDETICFSKPNENYGIEPLPNLDFKIIQGNSLISSFYGLDLKKSSESPTEKLELYQQEKQLISEFEELKGRYQNEPEVVEKQKLRNEIDKKITEITYERLSLYYPELSSFKDILQTLKENVKEEYINKEKEKIFKNLGFDLEKVKEELIAYTEGRKEKDFFLWDIYFAEVFNEKGGFDVVIGNPPYVSIKGNTTEDKEKLKKHFGFADDLYNHFYFKGIDLLKDNGILAYISSKTFWTIQTKRNLRKLILENKLLQLVDTANPFESAMVDTCITIVQKDKANDYEIHFIDISNGWDKKQEYKVKDNVYKNVVNNVFFKPNELNMKIYEQIAKKLKPIIEQWWDKISTSKNIEKYKRELEQYRQSLKPGDITLLGLITEGGVGIQTGNNGKFIGVLEGTKWADKVRLERAQKLWEFIQNFNPKELSTLKTKSQVQDYLNNLSENQIRELFDSLKEKYGRDIFGQGWLYRIVSHDEIADVEKLTDDEKLNGIKGKKTFVPYDKGDKDGNRWWAPTPYYIDWSRENVKFLKENSGKKGEGMPVVRNPQFYFREGFCWNNVLSDEKIKCRLKDKTVHSTEAMTFMSVISKKASDRYLICLLNSKLFGNYRINFVNVSHHLTTGDAKEFPIIIPTQDKLNEFENIFDRAKRVQEEKFSGKISEKEAEERLEKIQKELDEKVLELYGLK